MHSPKCFMLLFKILNVIWIVAKEKLFEILHPALKFFFLGSAFGCELFWGTYLKIVMFP